MPLDRFRFDLWSAARFKPDQPDPPDPYKVADAQSKSNIATAREQARLGMTGQQTPWGSIQYVTDPTSPSGFRAVTQLSPEQQALLQQSQDLTAQLGGMTGGQLGRVDDTISSPFDLHAARGTEISDIQRTFLDPQWNERKQALETDLMNRGIRMGSPAYQTAMRDFEDQRASAYDRMFLDAYNTANTAALQQRNLPLADLAALRGTTSTPMPGMFPTAQTPTPGVAPTDVAGPIMQNFGIQSNAANQALGGLYGLGAAGLGGWAQAGFPGLSAGLAMISDRRVKINAKRIAEDPRGWGIWTFQYDPMVGAPGTFVGFMVDEVEPIRPDVIIEHANGFKMINYEALAQ